jgi:hypothetical protein
MKRKKLRKFQEDVGRMLPRNADENRLGRILRTYVRIFGARRVPWLECVERRARSREARDHMADALVFDLRNDCPRALRDLVAPIADGPDHHDSCLAYLRAIDGRVHHGLYGTAVLCLLGVANTVVMPWLLEAAKKLKLTNMRFLLTHGYDIAEITEAEGQEDDEADGFEEDDIENAREIINAERVRWRRFNRSLPIEMLEALFRAIFTAP